MDSGIWHGIAVMLCWGIADFIQVKAVRQIGPAKTLVVRNVMTLTIGLAVAAYLLRQGSFELDLQALAIVALSSMFYVIGYFAFLRGFEVGRVSLVAPIAASFSVITVILTILFTDEMMSITRLSSIALIVIGLFLTSTNLRELSFPGSRPGMKPAMLTLLSFGIAFFVLGFVAKSVTSSVVFVYSALTQAVLFLVIGGLRGGIPERADYTNALAGIFLAHAVLVNGGWLAYIVGTHVGDVSVVAPLASVFSGVTITLAVIFFGERLVPNQVVGIIGILAGIAWLSA